MLLEYRERYGKGIRQKSVRAATTKYNACTLPLNLYDNSPLPSCTNITFSQQLDLTTETPEQQQDLTTETPEPQDSGSDLYLADDYLAVLWEGSVCIGRVITSVDAKSRTCSVKLYTEDSALIYTAACEKSVPINQVLQLLPSTSYSKKDDTIILGEEQYCMLKESLERETTTIDEESFE